MSFTLSRQQIALAALLTFAAVFAAMLLDPTYSHAALQKMAGYQQGNTTTFGDVIEYITNLRNGLIPIAIPVAGIGFFAGATMFLVGNQMATKVIFGVLGGVGLALSAPGIVS
ncbi:hypothetical protein C8N24_0301 [Solirubrobacter pauli]|uniref:TrbC/VIRB2 family protein n=1 Tax=Solirubrobacter pauli TaxID=166793 RepID=A0A660L804_9ACTN|nr:hypothetical protein [Solirubrobacter pauli]RKQ90496.1 hypothetical protein C8N24_0301 [Solirubrobacter pauli]